MDLFEAEQRARLYSQSRNRAIRARIGFGNDGGVWETDQTTAVKVCYRLKSYENERDCYRIFAAKMVTEMHGFAIPYFFGCDDDLLVVEMAIVKPPFILDFGKVYFDPPPIHYVEMRATMWEEYQELWGRDWPTIRKILYALEGLGIYYLDPRPKNILPANWDPELD